MVLEAKFKIGNIVMNKRGRIGKIVSTLGSMYLVRWADNKTTTQLLEHKILYATETAKALYLSRPNRPSEPRKEAKGTSGANYGE